jgi:colicin import membrane protein
MPRSRFVCAALLAMFAAACDKGLQEEQQEAREAREKAQRVLDEENQKLANESAAAERKAAEKADAARSEAEGDVASANREAADRVADAVRDSREKIMDAQQTADEEAREATQAFLRARTDLESSVGKQLDAIDRRTAAVRAKVESGKGTPEVAASVKQVETKVKTVRSDLEAFQTKTARSIDDFRLKLEQSLAELRKAVDSLESKS